MAESVSAVLAVYFDPYGEGTVRTNDCAIIITTAESHADEDKFKEMIELVCEARSLTQTPESRWQVV